MMVIAYLGVDFVFREVEIEKFEIQKNIHIPDFHTNLHHRVSCQVVRRQQDVDS